MNKKEKRVIEYGSTNGRWGLALVLPENTELPAEGELTYLGKFEGVETYSLEEKGTGQWIALFSSEIKIHSGAVIVREMDLQSNNNATLAVLGDKAVIEHYGYKGRSSTISLYINGERQEISPLMMAEMGLIETPDKKIVRVEIPETPSQFSRAFEKAGIK